MKILSPNETIEMLGTKEDFEEDYEDEMEENNKLDLMESQLADCEDLE